MAEGHSQSPVMFDALSIINENIALKEQLAVVKRECERLSVRLDEIETKHHPRLHLESIRIVVPYEATIGLPIDEVGRLIAKSLAEELVQHLDQFATRIQPLDRYATMFVFLLAKVK